MAPTLNDDDERDIVLAEHYSRLTKRLKWSVGNECILASLIEVNVQHKIVSFLSYQLM